MASRLQGNLMPEQVLLDFEYPEHRDIVLTAAPRFLEYEQVEEILALPMERLSENRLCVYRVRVKPPGQAHTRACFLKIASYGDRQKKLEGYLRKEFKAWKEYVRNYLSNPRAMLYDQKNGVNGVCLCYTGAGDAPTDPRPLRHLWRTGLSDAITDLVVNVLHDAHQKQYKWRSPDNVEDRKSLSLGKEYRSYLQWDKNSGTKRFLEEWIGQDGRDKIATLLLELGLTCPWERVEQCLESGACFDSKVRPVHGDYHQRNIIIEELSGGITPWLIDFEWTGKRHVLVDYALLEASLKLFEFAGLFSESEFLGLHDALDKDQGANHLESHKPGNNVWRILREIRNQAKAEGLSKEHWREQYYTASLFVTMGLLTKPSCARRMGYLSSAWFASHISG